MGQMFTISTMFLMLMALVPTFECYSMGAPDAACNAMTPGHSLEPQKVNQQNDWISGSFRTWWHCFCSTVLTRVLCRATWPHLAPGFNLERCWASSWQPARRAGSTFHQLVDDVSHVFVAVFFLEHSSRLHRQSEGLLLLLMLLLLILLSRFKGFIIQARNAAAKDSQVSWESLF